VGWTLEKSRRKIGERVVWVNACLVRESETTERFCFAQADEVITTLQSCVAPRNAPDSSWNIAFVLGNGWEKMNRKEEKKNSRPLL